MAWGREFQPWKLTHLQSYVPMDRRRIPMVYRHKNEWITFWENHSCLILSQSFKFWISEGQSLELEGIFPISHWLITFFFKLEDNRFTLLCWFCHTTAQISPNYTCNSFFLCLAPLPHPTPPGHSNEWTAGLRPRSLYLRWVIFMANSVGFHRKLI